MTRIFGLGEIVYDLLFKNMQPVTAKAGGSVLNAIISLARLGREVHMVSEIGNDLIGRAIISFLKKNNINTDYINQLDGNSTLALAFLNEDNEAKYQFFKDDSSTREPFKIPTFTSTDYLLFGSLYGIDPALHSEVLNLVSKAHEANTTIIYDPNFRSAYLQHVSPKQLVDCVEKNFSLADLIRGSDEDFQNIYGETSYGKVYEKIRAFCPNLVITANSSPVHVFSNKGQQQFDLPQIEIVSTVGAGDNFDAGIIQALIEEGYSKEKNSLEIVDWEPLVRSGIIFSSAVCQTMDNYIPEGFGGQ